MTLTLKYYLQLLKFRLSITVVFSAAAGYLLGVDQFLIKDFIFLTIGGLFVTGSANGFNQILEREYDKLMDRTASRPLPMQRLSCFQAVFFSTLIGLIGLFKRCYLTKSKLQVFFSKNISFRN